MNRQKTKKMVNNHMVGSLEDPPTLSIYSLEEEAREVQVDM